MNSNKFLVVGSNSFSGSHFVAETLKLGNSVCGVSRSREPNAVFLPYRWSDSSISGAIANKDNFQHHILDINTNLTDLIDLVDKYQPGFIVNFAAQGMVAESWLNPLQWYRTNLLSQVAFHDELRKRPFIEKYVHVTTPEVYGSTDNGWIKENTNFSPSTPYAVSRAACDMHLQSFYKAYGFPVIFTRAANVYGPGQQLYRIVPRTILSARTGKSMQLHGGGLSERSFIHIRDVVSATLQLALSAEPGTTWHLSTKEVISIRALVKRICKIANIEFNSVVEVGEERLGKDQSYLLDSSNIRDRFGWSDKIDLDQGLNETLDWVDRHFNILKDLPWEYQHKS